MLGCVTEASARARHARELFAPLGPTYDRYATLLSFGQDPRWRGFLVSRVPPDALRVADVACGTAAVSIELARRNPTRSIVGVDQSSEMLTSGRARISAAGLADRIELRYGRAEALPFSDREFDALTFTYLLRYVDEPGKTLEELRRVVRPGGVMAMLEFAVPSGAWRPLWELYVRIGLPAAGAVVGPGWGEVGRFLGGSIRNFYARYPLPALLELWRDAGIEDVRVHTMSLGGGVVIWGRCS
jgi:demethylmenaquinone methyltransferase/2-methoxy-6-polyprenyl-1,4-benzoquinol methylase